MSTVTPTRPSLPPSTGRRPRGPSPMLGAKTIDPFRLLRQYMLLLIGTGFAGILMGVAAHLILAKLFPLYTGEVLFEIRSGLTEARDVTTGDITQEDLVLRLANTESMMLTSRGVLETAVKEPDVQRTRWFTTNFVDPSGSALIDDAVDELEEDIRKRLVQGTNLFGLRWSTAVPADVPIILNSIGNAYIDRRYRLNDLTYDNNLTLFSSELKKVNRQIEDLGQEIEMFIREKGITTLDDPRSHQLSQSMSDLIERIADTNSGLTMAQSTRVQVAAKLEGTIEPSDEDRRMAREHPLSRGHEMAVLEAKTVLRELREVYHDQNHWLLRKGDTRLRALELEYEAKLDEMMTDNLHAHLKLLNDQIERYQDMFDKLTVDYQEKGTQLRILTADMSRYFEMEDQRDQLDGTRTANIKLIQELRLMGLRDDAKRVHLAQPALTPREKSFPKITLVLPLTMVMLVGFVTGLIFLRELTDQRVKSASDLSVIPDAPMLGVIPDLTEDPCRSEQAELVVQKMPHSVLAESYRQTWALIHKSMTGAGHQTLLLMGGLPGAGTTTVGTNFAAAGSASGRSVVIVDANFRRPRMAAATEVNGEAAGLGDILAGEATIDDAVQETETGISVIAAGSLANRVVERLNNGRFSSFIAELRDRFDVVIVDAPPAVVAGDALNLANQLDAAVLVVRAKQEQRGLVARLVNQLLDARCEFLGIVLNRPLGTAGGYFKKNFAAMAKYAVDAPST